jgi:hypothetical protein
MRCSERPAVVAELFPLDVSTRSLTERTLLRTLQA